jgi:4-amino-4-deoxy-L-arabinose transferase-like glycosyltransferase
LIAVALLAAVIRLAVLPFATTDGGDAVHRVWIAWRWLEDPQFIPHHVWGPLHFYLIGGVLALFLDPVLPPVVLHVMLGVAISLLLYVFTRIEFGSERAALIVALTSAVYPVAVRNSVSVRSETPCALFVLAAMIFVSRARRMQDGRTQAIAGGFFMTLAGMLRYEVWLLIPFFAVLFWRKRSHGLLFLAVAMIHPVIWTFANWMSTGDPFYSMNWAAAWELDSMGRSALEFSERLRSGIVFLISALQGLTPLVALACLAGAALSFLKREGSALWLLPLSMLAAALAGAVVRGSLVPKFNYTETLGLMLLPFSAVLYKQLGIDSHSRRYAIVGCFMVTSVLAFSSDYWLRTLPPFYLKAISPIPRIENQETALLIPEVVTANLQGDGSGLISDFYGWGAPPYVALLTRLHPDRIYWAPGAPNREVDLKQLSEFLDNYPNGVLLLKSGSRFTGAIGFDGGETARIGEMTLRLDPVETFPWPERNSPSSRLEVLRYHRAQ